VTPDAILQLGFGFWGSKTLLSAVELGLFTELAKGALDAGQLRQRLGLHERSARDFLDALVALGMLEQRGGRYHDTPATELFLDRAKPSYIGGILEMCNARLYPFWGALTEALRTGRPQSEAKGGGNFYEAVYRDPAVMRQFLEAMTGISMGACVALATKFPWKKYRTFTDVGSAQGALCVHLTRTHAHLSGTGFDLPVCGPVFEEYVRSFGLESRLRFQPGSFYRDPFPPADVIIMGHILHSESLENRRMLIKKAYEVLPKGGAYIVFEELIDDQRRKNAFALLMSLNMLIELPAGFNTTGADYRRWLRDAGFRSPRVEHLVGPVGMVAATK
jgi:hypothetical protein